MPVSAPDGRPLPQGYVVRTGELRDCALLPVIERAASELFAPLGIIHPDAAGTIAVACLEAGARDGLLWVCEDQTRSLAGFAFCEIVEGHFYLAELSVHPAHGRKGLGRALVLTVCQTARTRRQMPVWLSTFRSVPWNGPFYARMGFQEVPRDQYAPWQQRIATREAQIMDPRQRCFMRWDG